jgi:hypothetical protein
MKNVISRTMLWLLSPKFDKPKIIWYILTLLATKPASLHRGSGFPAAKLNDRGWKPLPQPIQLVLSR